MAILATVAVMGTGNSRKAIRTAKLTADVQTLNAVVNLYLANGGSLSGVTDPTEVLGHLKTVISQGEKNRNVGTMSGRGIDARLSAKLQSSSEAASSDARAVWDGQLKRFVVSTTAGSRGISAFDLDSSLAGDVASKESRIRSNVLYNGSAGWVWENGAADSLPPLVPWGHDVLALENKYNPTNSPPPGGNPPPATPPGITNPDPPLPDTPQTLPSPVITPPGGAFYSPLFPSAIFMNPNSAPAGSSVLQYKLNNNPWIIYTGPFPVAPGATVTAKNVSTNATFYRDSAPTAETYYLLVTSFSGAVGAKWNPSTGPSGLVSSVDNSHPESVVESDGTAITEKNTFTFKREPTFNGISPNATFKVGEITYHNGTIRSGSGSTGLSLHLDITLKNPSVATTGTDVIMKLDNTPNSTTGAKSADSCTLANPVTDYSINIGGVTYTLILKYGSISADQGFVSGDTLNVWEGADGRVEILGAFASSIPL